MKRTSDELRELLERVHPGVSVLDFQGRKTPCIELDAQRYADIISKVAGKSLSVNTDLNILQDGLGNAFVEMRLVFSIGNIVETFLLNAKTDITFFESLAETSMLALSSPKSHYGGDDIFMIQLPRPQKAWDALEIIRNALIPKDKQDAVTGI